VREQGLGHGQRGVLAVFPGVELSLADGLPECADVGDKREPTFAGNAPRAELAFAIACKFSHAGCKGKSFAGDAS